VTDFERMARLKEIVLAALDLPEGERAAFLERQCGNDQELLSDARSLLGKSDSIAGILRTGAVEDLLRLWPGEDGEAVAADSPDGSGEPFEAGPMPEEIGGFRIKRLLGEGGMGVVYEAEQRNPRRLVALKVIRAAARCDERHVKLFEREAHALAQLDHPGIAAIYGGGRTKDGAHFFAMELVRGLPLHEYIASQAGSSDVKAKLRLFTRICRAVDYAHKRGVIHRDLNPSNIFVLPADQGRESVGRGDDREIKILDFGLAKVTESDLTLTTMTEELGRIQGTLAYMSPEQARGDSKSIDHRTDVYSLGVMLYEMLTGRRPYDVRRALVHQALQVIIEDDPVRPSALIPVLRGDLETILLKALEKSPGRRYQSVSALAEDIERYLADRPILARPPTATYQLRKLVARHKGPFGVAAGLFVLILAFGVIMAIMYDNARKQRERAEIEAQKAGRISEFLQDMLASASPWGQGRDVTVRAVLDSASTKVGGELAEYPEVEAAVLATIGNTYLALGMAEAAEAHQREALEIRRMALGERHPDVAASLHFLGMTLLNMGKLAEAESTLTSALTMSSEFLAEDDPGVCGQREVLAGCFQWEGKWPEAEALYRKVLAIRRELPGDHQRDIGESLNDLGVSLWMQDRHAEAEPLYREALSIFTAIYGEDHPDVATMTDNLALLLDAQGKARESEPLHRRALEVRRKLLGEEHPMIGVSLANLGVSLEIQGRYAEAESLYRDSEKNLRNAHGNDHPYTANAMDNMALILHLEHKHDEAERYYREALEVRSKIQGDEKPETNWTRENLATLLLDRGRLQEAEAMLLKADQMLQKSLPERHWRRSEVLCRMGWCLAAEGRRAEADSLLRGTREAVCKIPNARWKIDILRRCVAVFESWGEPEEAAVYREELAKLKAMV
jgi:serine/threonine protein kinase/Tfp pilus assembly protein PilF